MFRRLGENVSLVADVGHDRHHELLSDRIDRRIRHLREELVEVVEENARPVCERCKRRVVAHRANRFVARLRHRTEDELDVLERPAKALLFRRNPAIWTGRHDFGEKTGDGNVVLLHPAAIRSTPCVVGLKLGVLHEAVFPEVEPEQRAGTKPSVAHDRFRRDVENSRLRRKDEKSVFR